MAKAGGFSGAVACSPAAPSPTNLVLPYQIDVAVMPSSTLGTVPREVRQRGIRLAIRAVRRRTLLTRIARVHEHPPTRPFSLVRRNRDELMLSRIGDALQMVVF